MITFGWSVKSGAELTKPVSLTTRTSRSRSPPQASRSWAMSWIAQVRAAAAPASASMPAPSLPVIGPFASRLTWPETWTRPPTSAKGT